MYQDILIESLDHFGRGVAHIDKKVVFINNALPSEVVDIKVVNDKKNYCEAVVVNYKNKSPKRVDSLCPYFGECGGCNLLNMKYQDTLDFKLNKIYELIKKNKLKINVPIEVVRNMSDFNYRNKISLKIEKGKIGFYQDSTHDLVLINECLMANKPINKIIENYKLLNIKNGSLTIRCNSNGEILLIINSDKDTFDIELGKLKKLVKLVGIVFNNKTIYGDNFMYERVGGCLFKVSYDAFFQVNREVTEKLFDLVLDNISNDDKVLDLFSGVGTLSMVASRKASQVIGVEIVQNAVVNSIFNANINKRDNVKFMLGKASDVVKKINGDIDTLIVDPPRKGLDKDTINFIINNKIKKIIYISCDVNTLLRDLKYLEDLYEVKIYKILDMFSYSYHVENFVVLEICQ